MKVGACEHCGAKNQTLQTDKIKTGRISDRWTTKTVDLCKACQELNDRFALTLQTEKEN